MMFIEIFRWFDNRKIMKFGVGAVVVLSTACTSAPTRDAIPPFRQGVITADQQTSKTFVDVNSFLRARQIDRAAKQPTLKEDLFVQAIESSDISKWHRAFSIIDGYAEMIERLLDPDQRSGVESELSALGEKINSLNKTQIPATLSAGFNKLGGLLIQLKSERDALNAIRKSDPAIQDIFNSMAEAIGSDPDSGVRGTVRTSWGQMMATISANDFLKSANSTAKHAAVVRYVDIMDQRDAEDGLLSALRLSIVTLAKSHHELSQGRQVSSAALIKLVQEEYKAYRDQVKLIQDRRDAAAKKGDKQ